MGLVLDNGCWVNPNWVPGTPGIFATVIGVSDYPYLDGSEASYLMEPLKASALTAFRFFEWLEREHLLSGCPVAKVWLLLAPSPEELVVEPALPNTASPTFNNIKDAVLEWRAAIDELDAEDAKKSMGFFFFSGHGLEVQTDNQVLLPTDYLRFKNQLNDAVPTNNLKVGNADLQVGSLFLFLDACRNDNSRLRAKGVKGTDILTPVIADDANIDFCCQFVYATSTSLEAYQRRDPAKGISIFGEALLTGLRGTPDMELVQDHQRRLINFEPLQKFLKRRVPAILKTIDPNASQSVRAFGSYDDFSLAELPAGVPIPAPVPVGVLAAPEVLGFTRSVSSETTASTQIPADYNLAHDMFGHEYATGFAQSLFLFDLDKQVPISRDAMEVLKVEMDETEFQYRFEFRLPIDSPVWVVDPRDQKNPVCALLPRSSDNPRYSLEVTFDPNYPWNVLKIEAGFGALKSVTTSIEHFYSEAERVWTHYELGNRKISQQHAQALIEIGMMKEEAPLPATLALGLLVQQGMDRDIFGWPENLMNWFPTIPDGPSIWLAQLLRYRPAKRSSIQTALEEMASRGLPWFTPSFEMGRSALDAVILLDDPHLTELAQQCAERFEAVARFYVPGGQFVTLVGDGSREEAVNWGAAMAYQSPRMALEDA